MTNQETWEKVSDAIIYFEGLRCNYNQTKGNKEVKKVIYAALGLLKSIKKSIEEAK